MSERKTVTLTKDYGIGKANSDLKAEIYETCRIALAEKYGEENVKWIREYSGSTGANSLMVKAQTIVAEGMPHDHCVTINPIVKSIEDRVTKKGTQFAFDPVQTEQNYLDWVANNERKIEEATEKKAKKIAADNARREAAKAAREAVAKASE